MVGLQWCYMVDRSRVECVTLCAGDGAVYGSAEGSITIKGTTGSSSACLLTSMLAFLNYPSTRFRRPG